MATHLLNQRGQFVRDGRPVHPVGFNYAPSSAGCQLWTQWDADVVSRDFAAIASHGFTAVRVFTFWADFEPDEGRYNAVVFSRLRELVRIAEQHGLLVVPSVVSVLHLLHVFDMPWRRGRDLFADPTMRERAAAFAGELARTLRDAPNVLAYDVHDEQYNLDVARAAALPDADLQAWHDAVTAAIRAAHAGVPVLQSLDHQAFTAGLPFRADRAEAYDLLGVHAYPQWTPFGIESIDAYKASITPAFFVGLARTFRPAMVDELGIVGASPARAAGYIRAASASAAANGSAATFAWCWQDSATTAPPFDAHPWPGRFGFVDVHGTPKPVLDAFAQSARLAQDLCGAEPDDVNVGLYLPSTFNPADGAGARDGACLFHAWLLTKRAHLPAAFAQDDLDRFRLVIVPSARHLTAADYRRLRTYVEGGGTLLWTLRGGLDGLDPSLVGVEFDTVTLDGSTQASFAFNGVTYPVDWTAGLGADVAIPVVRTTNATEIASYGAAPALTEARVGAGRVFFLNAPFESQLQTPGRLAAHPWHRLYAAIAARVGVNAPVSADDPDVEVVPLRLADDRRCAVLINHAPDASTVILHDRDARRIATRALDAKGFALVYLE